MHTRQTVESQKVNKYKKHKVTFPTQLIKSLSFDLELLRSSIWELMSDLVFFRRICFPAAVGKNMRPPEAVGLCDLP